MYLNIINERVKRFIIIMKQRFITEVCLYEPLAEMYLKYFCINRPVPHVSINVFHEREVIILVEFLILLTNCCELMK